MGKMLLLNHEGDAALAEWDARKTDEVAKAKATFEEIMAKGMAAFTATPDEKTGESLMTNTRQFDPGAEEILVMTHPMGG